MHAVSTQKSRDYMLNDLWWMWLYNEQQSKLQVMSFGYE